jgi:hypothetical protein
MKWAYQIFLGQTTLELEEVRKTLSVFPSIFKLDEEIFDLPAGRTRNIRAYVEVDGMYQMNDEEKAALKSLNLDMVNTGFSPYWQVGELEILREKELQERVERRKAYLDKNYPDRRYYICYFRQEPVIYSLDDVGPITVSFVHADSYLPNQYDIAQKRAKELEKERYKKKDFNLLIEARLSASLSEAKKGIFLDD